MSIEMHFEIEKESKVPVYRQLSDHLIRMIRKEQLLGGEKLPPERELAEKLEIARGTVKKAYELVEQAGLVKIIHGKGTFVLAEEDPDTESRKDQAVKIIGDALNRLDTLRFTLPEISSMIQVMIMERERRLTSFHIAFVDCNPESLAIFEKQILYVSRMHIHKYLLDEVAAMEDPEKVFSTFDLILTTTTHYSELLERIPAQKKKLLQAAVSPDRQTISELAAIPKDAELTVLYQSERFYQIITSWLSEFGITEKKIRKIAYTLDADGKRVHFAPVEPQLTRSPTEWVIVPPNLPLSVAAEAAAEAIGKSSPYEVRDAHIAQTKAAPAFKVIPFRYMIQRGSILHIDERISRILDQGDEQ
ncbi:MAG: GntR family transcriptional regulator [Spirochaetia bacterium]